MAVQKVFNYSFTPGTRQIDTGIADLTKDHIIKIVNSTTGKTIANPAMMGTIVSVVDGVITYEAQTQITLPSGAVKTWTLPPLNAGDILTIEIESDELKQDLGLIGDFFGLTDFTQYTAATPEEIIEELENIMSVMDPDYQQLNN